MKAFLESRLGQKLGVTRFGLPKEVYFEAVVQAVQGQVVILKTDTGQEIVLPVDKILMLGPAEPETSPGPVGFQT